MKNHKAQDKLKSKKEKVKTTRQNSKLLNFKFWFYLFTFIFFLSSAPLYAQDEPIIPEYYGYVNDFAKVVSAQNKEAIEGISRELEVKTSAQIAIVTVPTTKPLTIEEYAVELFKKWGIGQKAKDNGVLILLAANDRTIRIEVGYGLEGAIPDIIASQIINQVMIPEFKHGRLSKGLLFGHAAITKLVAKEYNVQVSGIKNYGKYQDYELLSLLYLMLPYLIIIILFIIVFRNRRKYHTGGTKTWYGNPPHHKSDGSFGGGFGGFGGGLSGGGGASGRW